MTSTHDELAAAWEHATVLSQRLGRAQARMEAVLDCVDGRRPAQPDDVTVHMPRHLIQALRDSIDEIKETGQ